jgi:hypothetical protein
MKKKVIWNPVNPGMGYKEYERYVESVIEKQINTPRHLTSLYKHLIDDIDVLKSLENVQLRCRTSEKPRWKGASDYDHQIDVSFSTDDERVILLVECKHWTKSVDFPSFSAFLIRVIDIATLRRDSVVLGMLVTTQGAKGKAGGRKEDRDCIAKVQTRFCEMGYYISFQWLPDG